MLSLLQSHGLSAALSLTVSTSVPRRRVLGWQPRPAEDAVIATAESLVALGLVKGSKKKQAP